MTAPVFISHSSKDEIIANRACQFLEQEGITCWIAPRNIAAGARYGDAIERAIGSALALVLLVSEHSNASEQVMNEIERAVHHKKDILPVKIGPVTISPELQYFISRRHYLDATTAPLDDVLMWLADAIHPIASGHIAAPGTTMLPKPRENLPPPLSRRSKRRNTILTTATGALLTAVAIVSMWMGQELLMIQSAPDSSNATHYLRRGDNLLNQGKLTEAVLAYQRAAEESQGLAEQKAAAANGLGWSYTLEKDDNRALQQYEEAIKYDPKLAVARINKGYLLARMGQPYAALELYRAAGEIDASEPLTASLMRQAKQQELAQEPKRQAQIDQSIDDRRRRYKDLGKAALTVDPASLAPLEIALLPLQYDGTYPSRAGEQEFVADKLVQALQKHNRFTLIPQQMISRITSNMGLNLSALDEPESALQVGRNLLAHLIIRGVFVRSGDHFSIRLSLVETASGKMLDASIAEDIVNPKDLPQVAERLAKKLSAKLDETYSPQGSVAQMTPQGSSVTSHPSVEVKPVMAVTPPSRKQSF